MKTVRLAREWFLVLVTGLILVVAIIHPAGIEIYPVLDWKGGNEYNMDTDKEVYHCGETPKALWIYQKQRDIAGQIKWALVPSEPGAYISHFPPRVAGMPIGIYKLWADVEMLPKYCIPGKYHFEGTLTYPLWLGSVSYGIRTQCFRVEP